jgi:adenosylmethionine-8-amino-7-oxononanoate aminotransferase
MSNLLLHFSASEIDDLLVLERGEGPYVFDTEGRRYIDALSSPFCAQIGYSHGEEMAAAATEQLTQRRMANKARYVPELRDSLLA